MVKVIHEQFGIRHGAITTIHDATNTQRVIDSAHKDFRRARATGENLIPTTTGSAKAITEIFPELKGRLNGMAVRVPILNASLTDAVFELNQTVDEYMVNQALKAANEGPLAGILGYEDRPLVSSDYRGDRRSSIVDAQSTMVVDGTQLKVVAWYDNETGYVCRMLDLARRIA
ncbi:glyceraldehyde-3-phosphate dehydrogenase type I [Natronospira proteinivora]|uniref:Glyceraldehyde-3-phosphate dehydrogenase type I n=1 Tax=Natronospira proteinivora TaxID=1807133 RepID=A0ABT1G5L1_9GAMM|nr:glyceraldehyde-3-phosphate dehydrogenase type I [Natronospira proteinivora]